MNDEMLHHFMQDLLPMIMFPAFTFAFVWIVGLIIGAFRHRANLRAQTDFHNRMMEKFSSAEEFAAYVQSEAGRSFFENLTAEPVTPLSKILGSIQRGVILTLLGLGLFVIHNIIGTEDSRSIMLIIATILTTVGVGFLISSAISYRLAKSWGLISADKKQISVAPSANTI